jgi:hypothetical protein
MYLYSVLHNEIYVVLVILMDSSAGTRYWSTVVIREASVQKKNNGMSVVIVCIIEIFNQNQPSLSVIPLLVMSTFSTTMCASFGLS